MQTGGTRPRRATSLPTGPRDCPRYRANTWRCSGGSRGLALERGPVGPGSCRPRAGQAVDGPCRDRSHAGACAITAGIAGRRPTPVPGQIFPLVSCSSSGREPTWTSKQVGAKRCVRKSKALREARRGTAPGLSGARVEHLKLLLSDADGLELLTHAARGVRAGPSSRPSLTLAGRLMGRVDKHMEFAACRQHVCQRRHCIWMPSPMAPPTMTRPGTAGAYARLPPDLSIQIIRRILPILKFWLKNWLKRYRGRGTIAPP